MQQQINLYRFLPHPVKTFLNGQMLLILYSFFFVILLLNYFYDLNHAKKEEKTVVDLHILVAKAQEELITAVTEYPRTKHTEIIHSDCKTVFASYLRGFAQTTVSGVWLTEIFISNVGTQITIKGHALDLRQVQQYLERLKVHPVFAKLSFVLAELDEVSASSENTPVIKKMVNFTLTTKAL